ncbi:MAG: helix-turn-helix transcriptional regulator [Bacteroidia bacterium]
MKTKKNKIIRFEDHIEKQYGKRGTVKREKFEQGYETFKLGAMLQEFRKQQNLTQEQVAEKCVTTKTYISRIENNASDIRLSTLMRIIREGLGGRLQFSILA